MKQTIVYVTLIVKDYDEAIEFYTKVLHFTLVEDTSLPDQKQRWVVICPPGNSGVSLVLSRAVNEQQEKFIGNQAGGLVFLILSTDHFWRDYHEMVSMGVEFKEEPIDQDYGTVAVFKDLYGNLWDLIQYHS